MNKKVALIVLTMYSGLMAGPLFAADLSYEWGEAKCAWPGGCRYTYQVPNPPAGKKWGLEIVTNRPVNDGKVWMKSGDRKVGMDSKIIGPVNYTYEGEIFIADTVYKGTFPNGGEIEFWMRSTVFFATRDVNRAMIRGTLVDAHVMP